MEVGVRHGDEVSPCGQETLERLFLFTGNGNSFGCLEPGLLGGPVITALYHRVVKSVLSCLHHFRWDGDPLAGLTTQPLGSLPGCILGFIGNVASM